MDWDDFTTSRARIACVSMDGKYLEELALPFKRAGYGLIAPGDGQADVSLVDLRDKKISAKKAKALAGVLRQSSPESSVFFLVDPTLDARGRGALRRYGEVVPVENEFDHLIERCRQMIRLRNIADEAGERLKTLASLNRLADFPPIAASKAPINVLFAGAPGPDAMAAVSAAAKVAGQSICVLSAGQTLRAFDYCDFDCAVFMPASEHDPLLSVTRAMRRHTKYSGIPVIHIAEDETELKYLTQRGAQEFVLSEHISSDLGARIQLTSRRARLLISMRRFLQACNGESVRDAASGAFTAAFLAEHGARLCARSDQTKRPLSALLVRLSAENAHEAGPGKKALHQAARLINRITRAEDIAARIGPDLFLILCPATIAADAAKMAMRIEGVLGNTVFRGANEQTLYSVNVESTVVGREPGAAIEEVIASALKQAQAEHGSKPPLRQSPR